MTGHQLDDDGPLADLGTVPAQSGARAGDQAERAPRRRSGGGTGPRPRPADRAEGCGARHRKSHSQRHLVPTLAGLLAAVGIGVVVVIAAFTVGTGASRDAAAAPASEPLERARDWMLQNLDPGATVLAPADAAPHLIRWGWDPDRLVRYGDGAPVDHRCCGFLLLEGAGDSPGDPPAAVRSAYDRSRAVATFADGAHHAAIRRIYPLDPTEIGPAMAAERSVLADAGAEVADNPRIDLSPGARIRLLDGSVDPRVLLALVGISGQHIISVVGFTTGPGEAGTSMPRRSVEIATIDGAPAAPDAATTRDVRTFLDSQVMPYRPDSMVDSGSADEPTLTLRFTAPSPMGLLASKT